jgi:hypothetical protein
MKKLIFIITLSFLLTSCEKGEKSISISEQVTKTQYFDSEIFSETNQLIYGKWQFLSISGGIAGGTFEPSYDYLEFVKYGIYGVIKDNQIKEIGRLIINQQDDNGTVVTFFPDDIYMTNYQMNISAIIFKGKDTLALWDTFMDGYFAYYKRVK